MTDNFSRRQGKKKDQKLRPINNRTAMTLMKKLKTILRKNKKT